MDFLLLAATNRSNRSALRLRILFCLLPALAGCESVPAYPMVAPPATRAGAGTAGTGSIPPDFVPPREDGEPCAVDAECGSGHCDGELCCSAGDCCLDDADCVSADGTVASCEHERTCQGSRGTATCVRFRCRVSEGEDDDTACDEAIEADDCGRYASVHCNGARDQDEPECPNFCETDADCDAEAYCDVGQCMDDRPAGGHCLADSHCASGHCIGETCCESGDCCQTEADCDLARYSAEATCEDAPACQGTRGDPVCEAYQCITARIPDDSACNRNVTADDCGAGPDVFCQGGEEQGAPPPCATGTCGGPRTASTCNEEAFCWEGACVPDQPNGEGCTGPESCQSGHCENNVCCTEGACCENDSQCPPLRECTDRGSCQGTRQDRHCDVELGVCANSTPEPVDDDAGCLGQLAATECGLNPPARCSGAETQTAPPRSACPPCVQTPQCASGYTPGRLGGCGRVDPDTGLWMADPDVPPEYDPTLYVGCVPGADIECGRPGVRDGICRRAGEN